MLGLILSMEFIMFMRQGFLSHCLTSNLPGKDFEKVVILLSMFSFEMCFLFVYHGKNIEHVQVYFNIFSHGRKERQTHSSCTPASSSEFHFFQSLLNLFCILNSVSL